VTIKSLSLVALLLLVGMGSLLMDARAATAPEPAIVPRAWEFEFTFKNPRPIAVQNLAGDNEWYWYISYKVVNNTKDERLFIPDFTIADDQGRIIAGGQGVKSNVFDAIKQRLGNRLLESPADIVGNLLRGEDNAKEGVIIWPHAKDNIDHLRVFIGGLSGETAFVKVPDPADASKTVDVLVSKTLMLEFAFPGSPEKVDQQVVELKRQKWVMR
jgi:hypothetical protein